MSVYSAVMQPNHYRSVDALNALLSLITAGAWGGAGYASVSPCLALPALPRALWLRNRDRTRKGGHCGAQHPEIKSNLTSSNGDDDAAARKTRKIQSFGEFSN